MKVLFATTNQAKIDYYAKELIKRDIKVVTLNDLKLSLEIEENGKDAVENAIIKAETYYYASKITTISIDDSLFIEGLDNASQPGVNVRRVNDKRLSDDEMLKHYSELVKKLGGKVKAKWTKGIAIYGKAGLKTLEYSRINFFLVDKPSIIVKEGYPLDSLSIIPEFNKYLSELSWEEYEVYKKRSNSREILDFIAKNI